MDHNMIHILFSGYIKNCLQKNKDRTSPIGFSTGTVLCGYKSQCTVMPQLLVKLTELSVLSHKDHRILCFALIIPYDGAALATVAAQAVSVVVSLAVIRRRKDRLPFHFSRRSVRFDGRIIALELRLGLPVALQELLVGTSFLVIQTIVNTFGVTASAGVGVAEKVCVFLMLVPSAYMHSMSAFVAQNMGAGQPRRAKRALGYGILTAFAAGLVMAWLAFFHGDTLSLLFAKDAAVAAASHSYLKAYAIDCMLTPFLFCFMGYYNGCEKTLFVMIQGIIGAFGVRIPIAYLVSRIPGATLFQIGLGTPASSTVQIVLCLAMFLYLERRQRREALCGAVTGP